MKVSSLIIGKYFSLHTDYKKKPFVRTYQKQNKSTSNFSVAIIMSSLNMVHGRLNGKKILKKIDSYLGFKIADIGIISFDAYR